MEASNLNNNDSLGSTAYDTPCLKMNLKHMYQCDSNIPPDIGVLSRCTTCCMHDVTLTSGGGQLDKDAPDQCIRIRTLATFFQ